MPRWPDRTASRLISARFAHNVREVRRLVGDRTQIFTALKANAYGFGLAEVADTVISSGADAISLADISDAVFLRERGFGAPILLYAGNLTTAEAVAAVEDHNLIPTIFDHETAETYDATATRPIRIFVKLDVGLERLGIAVADAVEFVRQIHALPKLEIHGVYTHLDVPDGENASAYVGWQFECYTGVCDALEGAGIAIPVRMIASSAVLRYSSTMNLNAVDPGHILFGLTPPGPVNIDIDLQPAFHGLTSRLIHTRTIDRSEFLDLAPFPLRAGMRIGVIPIGLRDGMASLTCGEVLVRNRRVPIAGPLSLEHTRVDLTDVPDAGIGDEVVVIGRQGDTEIAPQEVIEHQGFAVKAALALAVRESVPRVFL